MEDYPRKLVLFDGKWNGCSRLGVAVQREDQELLESMEGIGCGTGMAAKRFDVKLATLVEESTSTQ